MRGVGFLDGIVAKKSSTSTSPSTTSSSALTGTRAARQDPPPRALLLLCDGMLPGLIAEAREREEGEDLGSESASPSSSSSCTFLRHLDAVARGGAVGTLALREAAAGEAEADDPRLRRHAALFQLLGAHLVRVLIMFLNRRGKVKTRTEKSLRSFFSLISSFSLSLLRFSAKQQQQQQQSRNSKKKKPRSLSERFLGLSAALMTTDAGAAAAAAEGSYGGLDKVEAFSVPVSPAAATAEAASEAAPSSSSSSSSSAALLASRVSLLLGIDKPMQARSEKEKENESDDGSFDLVLVHLTADAFSASGAADAAAHDADNDTDDTDPSQSALSFADSFLRHVRSAPGAVDDRGDDALLVAVVFSSGSKGEHLALPLPPRGGAPLPLPLAGSNFPVPRPAQSFEFAEGFKLEPRRSGASAAAEEALLVASRCDGVLRVDGARRLLECVRTKKIGKGETDNEREKGDSGNDSVDVFPGGNGLGCILAEHLLDEVAYKIGRALKYGA